MAFTCAWSGGKVTVALPVTVIESGVRWAGCVCAKTLRAVPAKNSTTSGATSGRAARNLLTILASDLSVSSILRYGNDRGIASAAKGVKIEGMDNRPIGFLDSGVGAVSLWRAARSLLPAESAVLAADGRCFPYGALPPQAVCERAMQLTAALLEQDVKLIVVACNTASVHALARLRAAFPSIPFVGIVPVVKVLSEQTRCGTIAMLSTPSTAESAYLADLVRQFAPDRRLVNVPCPGLAELVEAGDAGSERLAVTLAGYLEPVQASGADVLGLGCTHYIFLRDALARLLGPRVRIYDAALPVARRIEALLRQRDALACHAAPEDRFLTTGDLDGFASAVRALLGEPLETVQFGPL